MRGEGGGIKTTKNEKAQLIQTGDDKRIVIITSCFAHALSGYNTGQCILSS